MLKVSLLMVVDASFLYVAFQKNMNLNVRYSALFPNIQKVHIQMKGVLNII